ncbi:Protein TILB like protein [Eufriesea mexicana]|uniref:Protein TILB like protein n=1 Tax=Eufriesea mexicana TaxID=516756 RepID=A0A310SF95_9HYME|nr:PREDICTED: protein tilB homolog [Eufriesea mexicana]OAD52288.1 Protein TILB like protein [Eufriesea mexicana]
MSRITLDLLRKRSEHNEGEISTLEEIALHQENIEKIELIDKTCRHLKILLLQHNLISKIENLSKLKRLEYLNLALNNIEEIENLEGLESLKKLDLTVNFIGNLRGIKKLRCNEHLEQLFLMGNPCTDYEGYREYAIATLIQLKELDGTPIERSERIKALQAYARIEGEIIRSCTRQEKARKAELLDLQEKTRSREVADAEERGCEQKEEEGQEKEEEKEEKEEEEFWNQPSRHTPEERVAIAHRFLRKQEQKNREKDGGSVPRISHKLKLFDSEGKPYNANQPKIAFKLDDERYSDRIVLEVALYKYLDTSYVDVDVHPDYVRVTIKGKVLQLTLPSEVSVNDSTAKRNTTTGSLLVTMPRLKRLPAIFPRNTESAKGKSDKTRTVIERRSATSVREYLEIGPVASDLDFSKIYTRPTDAVGRSVDNQEETCSKRETFCLDDDSMVPPLE